MEAYVLAGNVVAAETQAIPVVVEANTRSGAGSNWLSCTVKLSGVFSFKNGWVCVYIPEYVGLCESKLCCRTIHAHTHTQSNQYVRFIAEMCTFVHETRVEYANHYLL